MIISLGVFSVFRLSHLLLKDYAYAILIALFLFTSTVFNYYAFNYLPDAPALGFTLIGWFLVFKFLLYGCYNEAIYIIYLLFLDLSKSPPIKTWKLVRLSQNAFSMISRRFLDDF